MLTNQAYLRNQVGFFVAESLKLEKFIRAKGRE
jgi:hypothetical protein